MTAVLLPVLHRRRTSRLPRKFTVFASAPSGARNQGPADANPAKAEPRIRRSNFQTLTTKPNGVNQLFRQEEISPGDIIKLRAVCLTRAAPLTQWRGWLEDMGRSNRRAAPLSLRPTCAHRAPIIFSKTLTRLCLRPFELPLRNATTSLRKLDST